MNGASLHLDRAAGAPLIVVHDDGSTTHAPESSSNPMAELERQLDIHHAGVWKHCAVCGATIDQD